MKLKAIRPMIGPGYRVQAGELFTAPDRDAMQLIASGMAKIPDLPAVTYEKKVIVPDNKAAEAARPFRHSDNADNAQPGTVYSASNPVLPGADVDKQEAAGAGRRARGGRESDTR